MSIPSRRKRGSASTLRKTYKSPDGPPLGPASPSPRMRSLLPSCTPGGMFTFSFFERFNTPLPSHEPQYFSTTVPVPPHVGHLDCCCIRPRIVLTTCTTTPLPPHVLHVLTEAPGATPEPEHVSHVTSWLMRIFFCPPKSAVWKSISRSNRRSSPGMGPERRRGPPCAPPAPPKNDSKMSPRSKSCMPGPPGPPPIPLTPAIPNWSYLWRISWSDSTEYASLIVWNLALASSLGFTSGWYFRAAWR
mmetsp:Transcript_36843/g.78600  ORF Transcript_36843/g.78600 Transcript_36843/m.78600 type:complete len:246 (-) Transcript_36843:429-1166(-)